MAKEIGTIRPGTEVTVQVGDRLRHGIVESVDDQDNITVRVGRNSDPLEFEADRVASTTTRGTLFVEESP